MSKIVKVILLLSAVCCVYSTIAPQTLRPLNHYFKAGSGMPTREELKHYFKQWHAKHGNADITPTADREAVFIKKVNDIIRHNQNPHKTFTRGVNKFTGRYNSELIGATLMKPQTCQMSSAPIKKSAGPVGVKGSFFDWRDKSVVTPIRDQKNCGASYAFAAAAAVESHWGIRTGVPPVLTSEQQSIDCSANFGNSGCDGGLPFKAFNYLQNANGLSTENTYPFENQGGSCRFKQQNIYARVYNGTANIHPGDEQAIYQALSTFGPIAVGMMVGDDFLTYDGGIYQSSTCQSGQTVNHALTIIGYGTDSNTGLDYWIGKNSWGTQWGEEGYVRIIRGKNMCGIANCASYPNMNYTSPVTKSSHITQDEDSNVILAME